MGWASSLQRRTRPSFCCTNNPARFPLIWPEATLTDTWLRVTLFATPANGLSQSDVFYLGSAIGDTGTGNLSGVILVDGVDRAAVRIAQQLAAPAAITSPYDLGVTRIPFLCGLAI